MKNIILFALKTTLCLACFLISTCSFAQNVFNVDANQAGNLIVITYNLDKQSDISVYYSLDGGTTCSQKLQQVTGDVGSQVAPGTQLQIAWDVLAEVEEFEGDNIVFFVEAGGGSLVEAGGGNLSFTVNGETFKMLFVEGGTFQMGSNNGESDEHPVHTVTLSSYYMGEFEITQSLWKAVIGESPSNFKGSNKFMEINIFNKMRSDRGLDRPVEEISWHECQTFCNKLNTMLSGQLPRGYRFSLPTEAQWEFAARGGNNSKGYSYAGSNRISSVAWYDDNSGSVTHSVGSKRPNELGFYNMSGNVYEWCNDWYGSYSSSTKTNPKGANSGSYRVLRGGSWYYLPQYCRVVDRFYDYPSFRSCNIGARIALVQE